MKTVLGAGLLALAAFAVACSLGRAFTGDEFEHIHAAWYVAHGAVPFRDFYEQHHPLLYYVLAPLIRLLGDGSASLLAARGVSLGFILGCAGLVHAIACRLFRSTEAGMTAALLFLSSATVLENGLEVRPDTPQVFFCLLAAFLFLRSLETGSSRDSFFSGVSAGIGFLFQQKAVFFIAALAGVALLQILQRRRNLLSFAAFAPGLLLAVGAAALAFFAVVPVHDYVVTNWLLNMRPSSDTYTPLSVMILRRQEWLFWAVAPLAFGGLLWQCRSVADDGKRALVLIGAFLFATLFLTKYPASQYFLPFIAVACIAAGGVLESSAVRGGWHLMERAAVLGLLIIVPVAFTAFRLSVSPNAEQLRRVAFVTEHAGPGEPQLDGVPDFNVFRPDLHYFWYHFYIPEHGIFLYNKITGGRFRDFDACALVLSRRPKFVNGWVLDQGRACAWRDLYRPTPFTGLYQLRGAASR